MTRRWIILGFLLVLNAVLGYRLIAGETGMFAYLELRERHEEMEGRLRHAEERSRDLSREIRLLKTDRDYLESRIRVRMNYVGQGETLYLFPEEGGATSPQDPLGAGQDDNEN
ncbi:septum formation initiator family protein [Desulfocurvus sp.]|jgi:cell division protein FtsB|uniref:FtsB family cell division protein n=1 Tax=Desulfocurvus sp. TaxID=2871698 RepID=UPI0025BBE7C9|nr:septum formation initiator family protein [Desulfocurvus sp.]MCK9239244.1 septum formation initiator family protein [Desulfocurvus sp.]